MLVIIQILSLILFICCVRAHQFTYCDKHPSYNVTSLLFSPNPPRKDHEFTLTINGLSSNFTDLGSIDFIIDRENIQVFEKSFNICAVVVNGCPIRNEHITLIYSTKIPWYTPSGEYTFILKILNKRKFAVVCLKAETYI